MNESEFTTTCPNCGKPFSTGVASRDEKPDKARCINGHVFPVLAHDWTSGGKLQFRLGSEIESG